MIKPIETALLAEIEMLRSKQLNVVFWPLLRPHGDWLMADYQTQKAVTATAGVALN
jgi:hypothetical protein